MPVFACRERLLPPVFVACECNLLRSLHSGSCRLLVIAEDQGAPRCRALKDDLPTILEAVDLASFRPAASDRRALEDQLLTEFVVALASPHIYNS
jgi:hypothetical protein